MKHSAFVLFALALTACGGNKQASSTVESQDSVKTFVFTANPIVRDKFTADPAPLVYDGRLYLYVGHDEFYEGQDSASGGKEFNITEWLCYSTDDMKNWTDHGAVLSPADFKWAVGEAWASQVVEKDGKFYYYTTVQNRMSARLLVWLSEIRLSDRLSMPSASPLCLMT